MRPELQYWYPKCRDGKKISVSLNTGYVDTANPVLKASVFELLTLVLVKSGFDYSTIASILKCSKSSVGDNMHNMRSINHADSNGKLFMKAIRYDLLNPISIRGLVVQIPDEERRSILLEKIDAVTDALNDDLLARTGKEPYGISLQTELPLVIAHPE